LTRLKLNSLQQLRSCKQVKATALHPLPIAEPQKKLQKWVDSNAPEAKTQSDVTAKILESFDKPANGQTDKQLNSSEVETLLEKADIGNILTRGCWAAGIIDKFDTDGNKKLSTDEITGGLTEIGVGPPQAPPPTPTPTPGTSPSTP